MRIAILLNIFPRTSETFIANQIVGLIERGHTVDIFAHHRSDEPVHPLVKKYRLIDRTQYLTIPTNRKERVLAAAKIILKWGWRRPLHLLRSMNVFRYGRAAINLQLLCGQAFFMETWLKTPVYDVIHCHYGPEGIFGQHLREIGAVKGALLTMFHGYDISVYVQQHGPGVYKQLFAGGDLFTCPSEFARKRLITAGCPAEKVQKFKLGTNLKRFSFKERTVDSSGAIRLVTVARLTEKKGLEYSIRAVAKLSQRFKRLEYNIIGDGDLRPELTLLIEALGVGSIVHLLGWKTQEEVQVLLDQSHVFVLASVEGRDGDMEGLPIVLQEAQAMGLPVVCTRHSGIPEAILDGKSGFLVPERDVDALADRLGDVISRPEAWPEMGRQGRAFVETEYDLDKRNDALVELYRQFARVPLVSSLPSLGQPRG